MPVAHWFPHSTQPDTTWYITSHSKANICIAVLYGNSSCILPPQDTVVTEKHIMFGMHDTISLLDWYESVPDMLRRLIQLLLE